MRESGGDLLRCYKDQLAAADYLLNVRGDETRGAALGLADYVMEKVLILLEGKGD